ncbi:hypothetical protein XENTR_v10005221 [Xenopus tropicalis]|nr:hypothetical protein XENTR_v10005221 [Xenopus tropicalis]
MYPISVTTYIFICILGGGLDVLLLELVLQGGVIFGAKRPQILFSRGVLRMILQRIVFSLLIITFPCITKSKNPQASSWSAVHTGKGIVYWCYHIGRYPWVLR